MSVSVKYKNTQIANITETATRTLKTGGKYCEGDIVIENTKDSGGGGGAGSDTLTYGRSYANSEFTVDTGLFTTSAVAKTSVFRMVTPTMAQINTAAACSIGYNGNTTVPTVTITFAENSVAATYSNLVIGNNETTFDIIPTATGTLSFTVTAAFEGNITQTFDYSLTAFEVMPTYTVEAVEGATYGFALKYSGYYASGNKGVNSSYAICKVTFNTLGLGLKLDCINYAEANYDYGLLSNLNTTLALSNSADSSGVFKNFKGSSMATVQTVDYGTIDAGENFIYVKFIKDSSGSNNNDSLQFKLNFY